MWSNHGIYDESIRVAWLLDFSRRLIATHTPPITKSFTSLNLLACSKHCRFQELKTVMIHGGFEGGQNVKYAYKPIPATHCMHVRVVKKVKGGGGWY